MNDFLQFLINHYSVILSLSAFALSFINYINSRKKLDVIWEKEKAIVSIEQIKLGSANYLFKNENKFALIIKVKVINAQNVNIGFYDLQADDPDSKNMHMITMRAAIEKPYQNDQALYVADNGIKIVLNIPESDKGVFVANTVTIFDLIITPNIENGLGKKVRVSFKIPVRKKLSYVGIGEKYKKFEVNILAPSNQEIKSFLGNSQYQNQRP